MRSLRELLRRKNCDGVLQIEYKIPQTYEEASLFVKNHPLRQGNFNSTDLIAIPLRCPDWRNSSNYPAIYVYSRQCDGNDGLVAQHLMQPEGEWFKTTLLPLSLEDLGLTPENNIGELYQRAEDLGFSKCPHVTIPYLTLFHIEMPIGSSLVFCTEPIIWDEESIMCLARLGHIRCPAHFNSGYGDPDVKIKWMDRKWNDGMVIGSKDRVTGLGERDFRTRFLFEIPDNVACDLEQEGLIGANHSPELPLNVTDSFATERIGVSDCQILLPGPREIIDVEFSVEAPPKIPARKKKS